MLHRVSVVVAVCSFAGGVWSLIICLILVTLFGITILTALVSCPGRGSYEYDQIRVSLCLLCLVV